MTGSQSSPEKTKNDELEVRRLVAISLETRYLDIPKKDWGWLVIWSVDGNLASERYLMFQRAREFTADEARWGMNNVYIECCDQGWSWYGHILSFELSRDKVKVQLDAEAAEHMNDDGSIEVIFELAPERFEELRQTLSCVFQGYEYYTEAA